MIMTPKYLICWSNNYIPPKKLSYDIDLSSVIPSTVCLACENDFSHSSYDTPYNTSPHMRYASIAGPSN